MVIKIPNKAKQKGYRTVSAGKKILINNGFICANLEKSGRHGETDLFGLWDYLAIHDKHHLFIQFKTNMVLGKKKPRKWVLQFIKFGKKHGNKYVRYEIWNKIDRKYFEIFDCKTEKMLKPEKFIKKHTL